MTTSTNIFLNSVGISGLDYCDFLDHYIFSDPVSGVNIFYPLTAYGYVFNLGNLLESPENLNDSRWNRTTGIAVTSMEATPYTSPELFRLVNRIEDTGSAAHLVGQGVLTALGKINLLNDSNYTLSYYVSANSRQYITMWVYQTAIWNGGVSFDIFNGVVDNSNSTGMTILDASISAVGNDIYFCNFAFDSDGAPGGTTKAIVDICHRRTSWNGTGNTSENYNSSTYPGYTLIQNPQLRFGLYTPLTNTYPALSAPTYSSITSGGPLEDICFQDYCYKNYNIEPIKLYCVSTVNYVLSNLDESDSKILKIIYDFGDNTEQREISYVRVGEQAISPKDVVVSHTYYPNDSVAVTYLPSISVIRGDCCVNTYRLTLSTFRCSILEMYNDVVLHNAQQTAGFDVILTMEKTAMRQLFKSALNINDLEFAIPTLSSLPYLVEPVPPTKNKPKPEPVDPKKPAQPIDQNPVVAPEPGYFYTEGDGIDLAPGYFRIVPSEDIETLETSGITISGDGPPYLQGDGIDIRYT